MSNVKCQMFVCLRHLLFKIFIPLFIIYHLSFVILLSGCGDITENGEAADLSVSPSSVTVGINQSKIFSVDAHSSAGTYVNVSPTWSVTGGIGSISSTGLFTAAGTAGTGTIIATYGTLTASSTVTITNNGWVEGVMKTPEGALALGIFVFLNGHSSTLNAETDTKGAYTISAIPAGTYEAMTRETPLYLSASLEVTVASGETVTWSTTLTYKSNVPTVPTTTLPTI